MSRRKCRLRFGNARTRIVACTIKGERTTSHHHYKRSWQFLLYTPYVEMHGQQQLWIDLASTSYRRATKADNWLALNHQPNGHPLTQTCSTVYTRSTTKGELIKEDPRPRSKSYGAVTPAVCSTKTFLKTSPIVRSFSSGLTLFIQDLQAAPDAPALSWCA